MPGFDIGSDSGQLLTGTCAPWATIADVCSPCDDYSFDTVVLESGLQVASDVLYELTGRRWPGECLDVVRPCGYRTATMWTPTGLGWCGCSSSRMCGCRRLSEIQLPGYPVVDVTEVKIDGVVLAAERYRLDDYRWLVYLPESDSAERQGWPCCQRLDRADTEDDTWSVSYLHGTDPPEGGRVAAAVLGCEMALSCQPETVNRCRLPKRVTSITRQGVSLAILDPLTLFADGLTGLPEVDLWVSSLRHGQTRRRASVWVPGQHQPSVRRTNT